MTAFAATRAPDLDILAVLRAAFFIFFTMLFFFFPVSSENEVPSKSKFWLCDCSPLNPRCFLEFSRAIRSRSSSCAAFRRFRNSESERVVQKVALPEREAISPPLVAILAKLSFPMMALRAPPSNPVRL